ncbi:MAG: holo-ACP synthase [Thaumarchaeota archaeon]|nr:holo-ACP synthase [Nitrososphaerota archaeon]
MTLRIGVDIQDLERFRRAVQRHGRRFLKHILTEDEINYCMRFKDPIPHLAARFSGKEALIKALGDLEYEALSWRSVEIVSINGRPVFKFDVNTQQMFKRFGIKEVEVSLSHSGRYAVAVAIIHKVD